MIQQSLFDQPPRLHRKRDPQTSVKAAQRAMNFKAKHEATIYACLKDHGPQICETIAMGTGLNEVAVARRMAGLERRGLVRRDGIGVNRHGNECTRWSAI